MPQPNTPLSAEDADRLPYHDFFTPVTALAIEPMLRAARAIAGSKLLDVATGPGSLAANAMQLGIRCVGVDLSDGMIALATASHPGIEFRVAEVEHLPFADQSFDTVVCNFGLGHFPRPEASVAECVRTLKCGGRIALSWWDYLDKQRIQGLFREAITEIGAMPPPDVPSGHSILRFADTKELHNLLTGAGLGDVRVEEHHTAYTIADVATLWHGGLGSFALTGTAIARQDAATQEAIRAALERRANAYRTPAGLELPVAFKIASGQKNLMVVRSEGAANGPAPGHQTRARSHRPRFIEYTRKIAKEASK